MKKVLFKILTIVLILSMMSCSQYTCPTYATNESERPEIKPIEEIDHTIVIESESFHRVSYVKTSTEFKPRK